MSLSAVTVGSKFSSGSPMPIITTLVIWRSPFGPGSMPLVRRSSNSAIHSWPMISDTVRLRLKPCLPVEQKRQLTAQPAWVEMHSVPRFSSGMNTVSTALPLPTSTSHLRVPSVLVLSLMTAGERTSARVLSLSRSDLARSVMLSKSLAPNWWIQRCNCLARNGFSPKSAQ